MTSPSTPPGWYPDPSGAPGQRYWDGYSWVEAAAVPAPTSVFPQPATSQTTKPSLSTGVKIGLGAAAFVLAITALGSIGNSSRSPSASSLGSSVASRAVSSLPVIPESVFTPSQDNAIEKAQSYLRSGAFSRKGLIEQLEYNKYSPADATFAVEHIEATGGVDWNEQALKKAQSYLRSGSFSLGSLTDQLEYNGFTPTEAQYGANTAYEK